MPILMTSTLYQQIQQFYDASSGLWEEIWGEHLHHGYYGPNGDLQKERRQAQIDLIEEFWGWGLGKRQAGMNGESLFSGSPSSSFQSPMTHSSSPMTILDVGCGIGGSSLYLAQKYQARVTGITLSPVQVCRARERSAAAGFSHQTHFEVANALEMPFSDESFEMVWSLESAEHFPDKQKFLKECYRVLKPGGTLLMATWCHRTAAGDAAPLTQDECKHLAAIYRVYALPYVISLPEYVAIAANLGFQAIDSADWSIAVAPFWDVVIDSAMAPRAIIGLLRCGWPTIKAALSLGLMRRGYQRGLIRFGLLRANKV